MVVFMDGIPYNRCAMKRLWNNLISLKTAIYLITVISLLSLIGTLIPQGRDPREYPVMFPKYGQWILNLGFDDLYRGYIFLAALTLLSLSAVACTQTRIRLTRRRFSRRLLMATPQEILSLPLSKRTDLNPDFSGFSGESKTDEDGSEMHLRVSGRYALLGSPLLHIGFLLILAGGVASHLFGVEISITGVAGQKVPIPTLEAIEAGTKSDRLRRKARNIEAANAADPRLAELTRQIGELDAAYHAGVASPAFYLEFVDLWMDYYVSSSTEEMGSVKGWNSRVNVVTAAGTASGPVLRVNEPFHYGGYSFFQADWSQKFSKVTLQVEADPNATQSAKVTGGPWTLQLSIGEPAKPTWSSQTFLLQDFLPDFRIVDGQFESVSDQLNNPAALVLAYNPDGKLAGKAWGFSPQMSDLGHISSSLPYRFVLVNAEPVFKSGLQVCHDPGTPVVWLGCWIMMIGMAMTFYLPYFEEWVVRRPNGLTVLAVSGNRPAATLRQRLEALEREMNGVLKGSNS